MNRAVTLWLSAVAPSCRLNEDVLVGSWLAIFLSQKNGGLFSWVIFKLFWHLALELGT
jgi:hypothetical protein